MKLVVEPSLQWLLGTTIIIYLIVIYAIGYFAQRRISDNEDFLVAGRRLPLSLARNRPTVAACYRFSPANQPVLKAAWKL